MRILLVEPSGALASALGNALDLEFHEVDVAPTARQAEALAADGPYDVIVLDDAATAGDGTADTAGDTTEAAADGTEDGRPADGTPAFAARARRDGTRVLLLRSPHRVTKGTPGADVWREAARASDAAPSSPPPGTPAAGHADAVLDKPFTDSEFLAHIHDLERPASASDGSGPGVVTCGALTLDTAHGRAYYDDLSTALPLSPREYGALEALVRADGAFLSFDELVGIVCGTGLASQREVMAQAMYSLTAKLRRVGFFITKRGDRYRIR